MTTIYTAANSVPMSVLPTTNGIVQTFLAANTNTGDASYAPDGLAAAPIFGLGGQALQGDEIVAGGIATLVSYLGPLLNSGALCWVLLEAEGGAQQVANATHSQHAITKAQAEVLLASAGSPGDIKYTAGSVAPTGWLKANGALVSRATYAALFAALGTTYGAGDGSTTFALPDLRGQFIRGFDDGKGIDAGRVRGSTQADAVNPATLQVSAGWSTSGWSPDTCDRTGAQMYGATSAHNISCGTRTGVIFGGGPETRPVNIALLALIKY